MTSSEDEARLLSKLRDIPVAISGDSTARKPMTVCHDVILMPMHLFYICTDASVGRGFSRSKGACRVGESRAETRVEMIGMFGSQLEGGGEFRVSSSTVRLNCVFISACVSDSSGEYVRLRKNV